MVPRIVTIHGRRVPRCVASSEHMVHLKDVPDIANNVSFHALLQTERMNHEGSQWVQRRMIRSMTIYVSGIHGYKTSWLTQTS